MTQIKPFKAALYNPSKVKDVAKVICPPYDVISPEQQDELLNQDPHNFIHILLGKDNPDDNKSNNKYTRAKKLYTDWLKKGILKQDEKPCLYFYKQEYRLLGQQYSRLGFISLMKIEDEGESRIFPHENTHSHAIEDRLRLWRDLKANLSPIFVCYSDKQKRIEKIFNKRIASQKPVFDIKDKEGVHHLLWRLDDPGLIEQVRQSLDGQELFIADGHHRYEVAKEYRKFRLKNRVKTNGQEPFNYIMTYFTDIESRGLQIFPIHRVIRKLPRSLDFLEEFFRVDKLRSKEELLLFLTKAGLNEYAFGFYRRGEISLLRLKNKLLIDEHIKQGSKEYRTLDATILKHLILDRVGVKSSDVIYAKDVDEAIRMVDESKADAVFILNPVKIQQLQAIALNGERMPPKTTYFYPKVLSGLTIYKVDSE